MENSEIQLGTARSAGDLHAKFAVTTNVVTIVLPSLVAVAFT